MLFEDSEGLKVLRNTFGITTETDLDNAQKVDVLKAYIVQMIRDLAAVNFPYSSTRTINGKTKNIPKWPVEVNNFLLAFHGCFFIHKHNGIYFILCYRNFAKT